jgi:hypothetical protein
LGTFAEIEAGNVFAEFRRISYTTMRFLPAGISNPTEDLIENSYSDMLLEVESKYPRLGFRIISFRCSSDYLAAEVRA